MIDRRLLCASLLAGVACVSAPQEEKHAFTAKIKLNETTNREYDVTFTMVYVPAGKFKMGSPENEPGRDVDEGPVREIEVKPFWMGKFEVTWDEYEAFTFGSDAYADMESRPSYPFEPPDGKMGRDTHAAMRIQYNGARRYCDWLSTMLKKKFRLPTEAEWEYACRAGSDKPAPDPLGDYAWFADNSEKKNQRIGQKKQNAFGLHDMLGGVWEYCAPPEPHDCEIGVPCMHVLRGGSWISPAGELRAANRQQVLKEWNARDPNRPKKIWWLTDGPFCGFRLVRDVEKGEKQ